MPEQDRDGRLVKKQEMLDSKPVVLHYIAGEQIFTADLVVVHKSDGKAYRRLNSVEANADWDQLLCRFTVMRNYQPGEIIDVPLRRVFGEG